MPCSQGPALTSTCHWEAWSSQSGLCWVEPRFLFSSECCSSSDGKGALDFLFLPSLFPVMSFTVPAYPCVSAVGKSQRGKWQTLSLRVFGFLKFLTHVTVLILRVLLKPSAASCPPNSSWCPSKLTKVALWLLKGPEHWERFAWTMRAPQVLPLALPVQIPDRP